VLTSQPNRYVLRPGRVRNGPDGYVLIDTHTNHTVKTYRSVAIAASDMAFLNEHTNPAHERAVPVHERMSAGCQMT
jgi:hypothetical protein